LTSSRVRKPSLAGETACPTRIVGCAILRVAREVRYCLGGAVSVQCVLPPNSIGVAAPWLKPEGFETASSKHQIPVKEKYESNDSNRT
jgi:hypothetical protein